MALKSGWKWLKTWPFHTHSLDRAERKCSMDCHYPKENWRISRILNPAIELSSMNDIYRYWSKNQFPINALLRVLFDSFWGFWNLRSSIRADKIAFPIEVPHRWCQSFFLPKKMFRPTDNYIGIKRSGSSSRSWQIGPK